MTATERAQELARRKSARSVADASKPSPTKGKATKGKPKTGTVKRLADPGAKATADATVELEGLPHVDAAPDDGSPAKRLG